MKNISYKTLTVVSLVVTSLFITSCDKEEAIATMDVAVNDAASISVKNGALQFNSAETFFATLDMVEDMSSEELDAWESTIGFISLRTATKAALDELDCVETEEQFFEILDRNSSYIQLKNGTVDRVHQDMRLVAIVNTEGVYLTPEYIFTYIEDGKLTHQSTIRDRGMRWLL